MRCRDADRLRTALRSAAQLHAIHVGARRRGRHKAARHFLQAVPAPCGWTSQDWDLVAHVVRYQQGAEPAPKHEAFAQLSSGQQDRVRGLSAVLRLARGLHRCGLNIAAGAHVDATASYVWLRVAGIQDTKENAARLAAAKHLLEEYLRRPVLIESAKATPSTYGLHLAHSSLRYRLPVAAGAGHVSQHLRPTASNRRAG
jgi:exopolyphosphatase/pppGpp-phosphohydrolase